jgi:hypothetical protein
LEDQHGQILFSEVGLQWSDHLLSSAPKCRRIKKLLEKFYAPARKRIDLIVVLTILLMLTLLHIKNFSEPG